MCDTHTFICLGKTSIFGNTKYDARRRLKPSSWFPHAAAVGVVSFVQGSNCRRSARGAGSLAAVQRSIHVARTSRVRASAFRDARGGRPGAPKLLERVITPGTDGLGGPGGGVPALAGGRRCRSRRRESAGEFRAVLRMLHVATTLPRIQIRLFPIYRTLFRFPSNV
jgi:hypothetical protein